MPFAPEFDDVYAVIKGAVEGAATGMSGRCFRLDESRPAGRITDRLLGELQSATLCIADITGTKPNVMWEVGYAMALERPVILISQDLSQVPFDIKDMQCIPYDRSRLTSTLVNSLRHSVLDTIGAVEKAKRTLSPNQPTPDQTIGTLLAEIGHLKEMVAGAVSSWKQHDSLGSASPKDLQRLVGDWLNKDSGSHSYVRLVGNELVAPYCYSGNDHLTGVYFGWRKAGEFWFARYKWIDDAPKGFTFLKEESLEVLSGAWWSSEDEVLHKDSPPKSAGVPSTWLRRPTTRTPKWAASFLAACEKEGLAAAMARTN